MSRFRMTLEQLPDKLQQHICCIQMWTNLTFDRAEDWRCQNQGWNLHFTGDLYKFDEQTYDSIIERLKMEFEINPHLDDDSTLFDELEAKEDGWVIYVKD